ncbi:Transposon protein, putative, CACTA, En/Spm sub-class [Thalictrum thalictroides]|uniref:Transposon protein, putative, CACTA, En/Spm sub-class n=1 Tax=Thalictrum thalictroides TaxID=46969 RepID=A0A7J6VE39_THATH|nr:Transposon protein, putative, CACTA, En/Spm sub-class [Thalictrum thalictroides]
MADSSNVSETLKWLAFGPRQHTMSYSGYIINGQRFHRKRDDKSTQNSGVSLEATPMSGSNEKIFYYGVINDIILLDYRGFYMPVFYCDWANIENVNFDDGFTLVNLHQGNRQFEKDSFILASQAKQVFYWRENGKSNWHVVLQAPPRGFQDLNTFDEDITTFSRPLDISTLDMSIRDDGTYARKNCEGIYVKH